MPSSWQLALRAEFFTSGENAIGWGVLGANDIMFNTGAAARIGTKQEIVITANEDFKLPLFGLDCVVAA